jgi:hypothetical protein
MSKVYTVGEKERLKRFNGKYLELTPYAKSRGTTCNLTEIAAILNMSEKSAFTLASLAGAECDGEYDLGLCQSVFEAMRVRAIINEGAHPEDVAPMSYGVNLREIEGKAAQFSDTQHGAR